ncbi:MAG: carboxymuconolactone decarboxylase family protein [Hyphomicrobiaceae bacterium]|nr:carboxymuconolactone decarboxylase family protein [Hyphomicrobiaceae bacterium]
MSRIEPIDPQKASGQAKELLDAVQSELGATPNLIRTLAQAPSVLNGYLALSKALSAGALSNALREQIALAIAGENNCDYCASAHTLIGRSAGVNEDELSANLQGESNDARTQALLTFAKSVVAKRGFVSDRELADARTAGISDGEIVEVVGEVARNILTNYLNHVAQTEIDFPFVSAGEAEAAAAA